MLGLLTGWLDAVYEGDRSVTSITFDAGHDWHGTPLQVVYDALGDEQLASWWVGLTLIKAAVLHPHAFYAYRPPAFTDVGLRGLTYWPDWARAR
ncbi:MAG: hypothetical protein HY271_21300 [Deltaproteobacteria bacterium]|nr:hypothetical protein [Deltaproteobacteria bacterium]